MTIAPGQPFAIERPQAARSLVTAYYMIIFATALLVALGFVMVVSSHTVDALSAGDSPWAKAREQLAFIGLGLAAGFALSRVPIPKWEKPWAWVVFAATLAFQAAVLLIGESRGGNTNWLVIGNYTVQPSEFLKYGLAVWLASVLVAKARMVNDWFHLAVPALLGVALAGGLVVLGHDAGTASVIGLMAVGTLVVAGVPWHKIGLVTLGLGLAAFIEVMGDEQRRSRLRVLFDSSACEKYAECWQVDQASYALAEGGVFGQGLGASRVKWEWLSQADSDFIFAVIGAELGLMGCCVVLLLFGVLAIGLLQVVRLHPRRFAQVTVGAISCWLIGQAIVNIGMVIRVLPVIGVPLPFVSAGGSALIAGLAAIGTVIGLMRTDPDIGPFIRAKRGVVARAFGVLAPRRR
ncbi:MAG: putative lipid II flippase FtsW [Bifidobacteriaceae bacterium]|jgi:cell division protein FtsW|nr:putative lipid II flippase FtsW [Bifidobacteriaceae bacterium]